MKNKRIAGFYFTALTCLALAFDAPAADGRINLALSANGAVATQKDNPFGMPPTRGNDGLIVTDQNFAHTGNADNEWWEVNLGAPKSIAEVRFWLRSDQIVGTRDSNLRLVIYSDAAHSTVVYSSDLADGSLVPLPYRNLSHTLPSVVTGQVVRIEHPAGVAEYLQINEVQVFNEAVEEVNLALAGSAAMSSIYSTYYASRAIDGVNDGVSGYGTTGSTAHSAGPEAGDPTPWWWLDLGSMQTISSVRVFLSADTVQTRNDDIAVALLDDSLNLVRSNYNAVHPSVVTLPGHDFPNNKEYLLYTFNPPVSAQFVQVSHTTTDAQYLVLPEVEVFKDYAKPPSINIVNSPTNQTLAVNASATLSVSATVSGANMNYLSYQWQSNGVDIVGANGASYTTPALSQVKNYTYGVKLLLPGLTVATQAVVTVTSDTVPPSVTTNWFNIGSAVKMTVGYSELVHPATATNAVNYHFAGGPVISGLALQADGKSVTFVVSGLETGDDFSLAISGIKDLVGNKIQATNLTGTMPTFQINYAPAGTATQSSDPWGYPAISAIDGNLNNFTHTYNNDNEWWEVDLGSPKSIGEIDIWFRGSLRTRDQNILVTVLNNPSARSVVYSNFLGSAIPPQPTDLLVAPVVTGQIVRIEHPPGTADYLCLGEVLVSPRSLGFSIVQPPVDTVAVTNAPADFTVVAQGAGPFTYQWARNGTPLAGATNAVLHIPAAGPGHIGTYTVVVSSPYRTHTSAPALLSLVPPATVNTILKINFDGTLSGTAYTLAPGETDVTGTFAALQGSESVANGVAVLSSGALGQGFSVANNLIDGGSGVTASFVAEMLFVPTVDFVQGTSQTSGYADLFSFGSTWWDDSNHGDGVFALRYTDGTNYQLRVDSVASGGALAGTAVPQVGVTNHVAIVYIQGPGMTNNALRYYLNGDLIATLTLPNNVGSAAAGSVIATFGQAVPNSTFFPRGLDGALDAIAYSTFSGVFSPKDNFVLHQPEVAPLQLSITRAADGKVTLTWDVSGYWVQANTDLGNPAGWVDVVGGDSSPVTVTVESGCKFYRLRKQ